MITRAVDHRKHDVNIFSNIFENINTTNTIYSVDINVNNCVIHVLQLYENDDSILCNKNIVIVIITPR